MIRVFADGMEDTARRKELYMGTAFVTSMGSVDLADYSAESFQASTVYILGGSGPSAPPASMSSRAPAAPRSCSPGGTCREQLSGWMPCWM
ncbi:hypothetical protein GXW82_11600 [Streptacidiphilus sp. 4-A2]|nr:hypothetical protein [Streptacidiphilus sp. 4-A2]